MRPTIMTTVKRWLWIFALGAAVVALPAAGSAQQAGATVGTSIVIPSTALAPVGTGPDRSALTIDGLYFETTAGRTMLAAAETLRPTAGKPVVLRLNLPDGRIVRATLTPDGRNYTLRLSAEPAAGIVRWGLAIGDAPNEYYTGLMERAVDGPQQASWAPGITAALNLAGQRVDMIVKPTTSVYAPFYLSSRGYAVFVKGTWPGRFSFGADTPGRVKINFEGPSLEMKIYLDSNPAALVQAHAMDAGPPVLPPKWVLTPWRWRDEHSQLPTYYDGTPVTGPFNSQVMEDVLLMKAFGIPNGVYWVDRPWGPGRLGYDDFEIDPKRLPNFAEMVKWLNGQNAQAMLWIAPFVQGQMEKDALAKGYNLAGQPPQPNNYPLVDLTNPAARAFWQAGFAKLLKLGVAGFKLDRGEENIPEEGPFTVFDGRSIREQRNAYPVMFVQAAYEEAKKLRGDDFFLMPRGAYTGSARYGGFWGGDIGGTQEGLRASIVAVQRAAVMGYPYWGSDTCGYNEQLMEQEVCARWLAFSAFTPIMEVGPTRNVGFWDLPRDPKYDEVLIATWRFYARLHQRLVDYAYRCVKEASSTGMPIVRPLFLVDPKAPLAWSNWNTYLYGPDIVVSPIWEKGRREATVYLPSGGRWRDAWRPGQVYDGGRMVTVRADVHQIPLFVREGSGLDDLGDLNREYEDAMAAARQRPDLKKLDAELAAWFAAQKGGGK
jgi:alpha-glucosidase (family GH31 glycosyl hydrolase)